MHIDGKCDGIGIDILLMGRQLHINGFVIATLGCRRGTAILTRKIDLYFAQSITPIPTVRIAIITLTLKDQPVPANLHTLIGFELVARDARPRHHTFGGVGGVEIEFAGAEGGVVQLAVVRCEAGFAGGRVGAGPAVL